MTWSSVDSWCWLSPLRLAGRERLNRIAHLVVIDPHTDQRSMGEIILTEQLGDQDYVSRVFARLRLALARDIALALACQDGTPVRAEHDLALCQWCGARWDAHLIPGES